MFYIIIDFSVALLLKRKNHFRTKKVQNRFVHMPDLNPGQCVSFLRGLTWWPML